MAAKTITAKVQVNADRTLTVQLPNEIQTGEYEMVLVLSDTPSADTQTSSTQELKSSQQNNSCNLDDAWKIWVQEVEQLPINPMPATSNLANSDYQQHLVEKYRAQGLDL